MNRQRQTVSLPVSFVDPPAQFKWRQLRSITTADFGAPEPGYPYTSNRSEMGCP